ncbi:shikimate kinase [Rhodocaloribacter sp.]
MIRASRIYLTGFMGSGKSTVGPEVAAALGYAFVDLDEAVAADAGTPVASIFAEAGEAEFRVREARMLRRTGAWEHVVVALGGGALADEANLAWALGHGTVVYLRVPPETLAARLCGAGQAGRPLLCDEAGKPLPPEALRAKVEAMLARREPFYRRAHVVVEAGAGDAKAVAGAVLRALGVAPGGDVR